MQIDFPRFYCDSTHFLLLVVPAIPQSEVLAKFFEEIGEKCGEILVKFFAEFRPSISRENGRKTFHEKSSTFSTVHQIKFFHCCNSGGVGVQLLAAEFLVIPGPRFWQSRDSRFAKLGTLCTQTPEWDPVWILGRLLRFVPHTSRSPKASHPKAGRSDFRNQRS